MSREPNRARRSYRYRPGKLYISLPGHRVYFRESDTRSGEFESFEFVRLVKHPKTDLFWKTCKTVVMLPLFVLLYVTNAVDFFFFTRHGRKKLAEKTADRMKALVDGRFSARLMNVRPATLLTLLALVVLIAFAGYTMSERSKGRRKALSRDIVAQFLGVDPSKVRVSEDGTFSVAGQRHTAGDRTIEEIDVMFKPRQWLYAENTPVVIQRYNKGSDGKTYEPTLVSVAKDRTGLYTVNKNEEIVFDAKRHRGTFDYEPVRYPSSGVDYATDEARKGKIAGAQAGTDYDVGIVVDDIERPKR